MAKSRIGDPGRTSGRHRRAGSGDALQRAIGLHDETQCASELPGPLVEVTPSVEAKDGPSNSAGKSVTRECGESEER